MLFKSNKKSNFRTYYNNFIIQKNIELKKTVNYKLMKTYEITS